MTHPFFIYDLTLSSVDVVVTLANQQWLCSWSDYKDTDKNKPVFMVFPKDKDTYRIVSLTYNLKSKDFLQKHKVVSGSGKYSLAKPVNIWTKDAATLELKNILLNFKEK